MRKIYYQQTATTETIKLGLWRGGRVVECDSLENCCPFTRTVGSNPTLSAIYYNKLYVNSQIYKSCKVCYIIVEYCFLFFFDGIYWQIL